MIWQLECAHKRKLSESAQQLAEQARATLKLGEEGKPAQCI
jgi:hypothetical protein